MKSFFDPFVAAATNKSVISHSTHSTRSSISFIYCCQEEKLQEQRVKPVIRTILCNNDVLAHMQTGFGPLVSTETVNPLGLWADAQHLKALAPPHILFPLWLLSSSCWRPIASLFLLFWKFSYFTVHGTVKPSCPLSRKTAPEHNGSTSMLDGGDVVLWVILSISLPPNSVRFHLTTALCPKPLNHLKVNWQTLNGSVHVPSWAGPSQVLQSVTAKCVTSSVLGDWRPNFR